MYKMYKTAHVFIYNKTFNLHFYNFIQFCTFYTYL